MQFLVFIIIYVIVNIFHKNFFNPELAFNLITINFFTLYHSKMLAFLFIIIYCRINKYLYSTKIVIFFIKKITKSMYFNIYIN